MPSEHPPEPGRPDPEVLLRQVQAAERAARRGQLKIFLGYASGVGKSFRLFDEGRRRHARGEDVVIAATQPEVDADVAEVMRGAGEHSHADTRRRAGHRRAGGAAPASRSLPRGRPGVRQPAGQPSREAVRGRPGNPRARDLGAHVDQSRVHRRAAGIRPAHYRQIAAGERPAAVRRIGRRDRRRRCSSGGDPRGTRRRWRHDPGAAGAAAFTAAGAGIAAHGRCRRSSARDVSRAARHPDRRGGRRSGFWCA